MDLLAEDPTSTAVARVAWPVMGTVASLACADQPTAERAAAIAATVLAAADERFSSYRPDSEFSRFTRGEVAEPSGELAHVLAACSWLEEASNGVFSLHPAGPDAPPDVAGYVKGWAVDAAADALDAAGVACYALGVGGDWRCRGGHPSGRPWRLALLDPSDRSRPREFALLRDGALATSGRYERGDHVLLPPGARGQRGEATATASSSQATATASFSVAGPRLAWADAFATIGLLLGPDGLGWVAGFEGYTAAAIGTDSSMLADAAFPLAVAGPQGRDGFPLAPGGPRGAYAGSRP